MITKNILINYNTMGVYLSYEQILDTIKNEPKENSHIVTNKINYYNTIQPSVIPNIESKK